MAAWPLVHAGLDVLMLERGPWVPRGAENWEPHGTLIRTPYFNGDGEFVADTDRGHGVTSSCSCVGGASVFYGAVSLRLRERDLLPDPELIGDSGSRWPFTYEALRPYYRAAERILAVAGEAGGDPTEPRREGAYPGRLGPLSEISRRIGAAAASLGLRPFRLPLAITFAADGASGNGKGAPASAADGRPWPEGNGTGLAPGHPCVECGTCDTFACAVGAKNDVPTRVLPALLRRGLELRPDTAVTRLVPEKGRLAAVECVDRTTGARHTFTADRFILAAGALGTPHLLLASRLDEGNPAGDAVGRYLVRHCSAIVYGAYSWLPRHGREFHKQLGIHDFYFGDGSDGSPSGKLGGLQQVETPSMGTVDAVVPRVARPLLRPIVRRITGLLALAEDRPRHDNRVRVDRTELDEIGLPRLIVEHRYDGRDLEARARLIERAKRIHRAAGSPAQYVHFIDTFSHALGTVRMGTDPGRDPLDPDGRFRGLDNLFVADGSALPTGGAVNPSLTIAANALRIGHRLAGAEAARGAGARVAAREGEHADAARRTH